MPGTRNYTERYTPSILDRLSESRRSGEAGQVHPESRSALEAAIVRDLSALLNTRREREPISPEYTECSNSLLAFGIPDLSGINLRLVSEQNRLRRTIEAAIKLFEPRLADAKVRLEHWDEAKPLLRFQVEAYLNDEPVAFDTVFRSEDGEFLVQRSRAA